LYFNLKTMTKRLFEILDAKWLIHRDVVFNYLPVFISFLNGQILSFENDNDLKPFVIGYDENPINPVNRWDLSCLDIPENSIAVIPIQGVMCSWNTMDLVNFIHDAEANPNIIALVFPTNSPGGMVFYMDIATEVLKNCTKPTVGVIMNIAASGACWLISAMNYRIVTSPLDRIGSIGVKTSFTDWNGFLKEKLGVTVCDLYASKSTRKDEEIRELLKGNEKPIMDDLDFTNEFFHQAIQTNLGIDPAKYPEVFTGAMFNAQVAIDYGLANEINSMEYALKYAYDLGIKNKINQFINQNK